MNDHEQPVRYSELAVPSPVYEIRVRGRLDSDRWAEWFEGMLVTVEGSETVFQGPLADQAALYGLLSRLRDLAVPLLSVRVLGERELSLKAARRRKWRINWLLLLVYLLLSGGVSALIVFLTTENILDVALALALLFALLGAIAYGFSWWDGGRGWRWMAAAWWGGTLITAVIYLAVMDYLHPALVAALFSFLLAGGLLYLLGRRQGRISHPLPIQVRWEKLGTITPRTGNEDAETVEPEASRLEEALRERRN